ncbi:MAG: hypothetical protein ABWY93_07965 [Mycobacterium sp.]
MTTFDQAQRWHAQHQVEPGHDASTCWCCCFTCDPANPYFAQASADAVFDPSGDDVAAPELPPPGHSSAG